MIDTGKLKELLTAEANIPPERFDDAKTFAEKEDVSIDHALISLKIADGPLIGKSLSTVTGLPYANLLEDAPEERVRGLFSTECAVGWKVCPTSFDPDTQKLSLAVNDPAVGEKIERIYNFFLQPSSFNYSIAAEDEIVQALQVYFGVEPSKFGIKKKQILSALHKPKKKEPEEKQSYPEPMSTLRRYSRQPARKEAPPPEKPTEPAYAEMSKAVVGVVTMLVRTHLKNDPAKLAATQARLRYCQLLASRLNLTQMQTDALILAAWLSSLENNREIARQLSVPYKLEELLFPGDIPEDKQRTETRILSLVATYTDLTTNDPAASKDVNLTRRNLRMSWSSSPTQQNTLEMFLQVLMDEQFLAKLDQVTGTVLIVDPEEVSNAALAPPLTANGYEVHVANDASEADSIIAESAPNLIVSELNLPGDDGLKLFARIKKNEKTADIPFIMIMGQEHKGRSAECLRAGVDDFLVKPLDLELLFIRMQKLIELPADQAEKAGVKGSLGDMSFTDMIQILSAGGKSMEILLANGDREGRVYIQSGTIIHASVGDQIGEEAFFKLMKWVEGDFTTKQCSEFPEKSINSNTMSLLMEGARQGDENID